MSSSSLTMERTTKITFGYVEIIDIEHMNDMTDEQVADKWMQPEEFERINKEFNKIVKKMVKRVDFDEDENTCRRGLDCWLPDVADDKTITIETAIRSVLNEQYIQNDEGIYDDEMLADAYSQNVGEAVYLAYNVALADEKEANRIYEADQMKSKNVSNNNNKSSNSSRKGGRRGVMRMMKGLSNSMRRSRR